MNFKNFDLNLLRVLDALLLEKSTVKAGRRLGLSQPAVSAALGRLRRATGDVLFVRSGQGMIPTEFARNIETPLRIMLGDLETLLSTNIAFEPKTAVDVFKIAGSDFYVELLMPQLADRLATCAPGMKVQLVDLVPDSHLSSLQRYAVDMALVPQLALPDWAESKPLFHSDFLAIARKGHSRIARAGIAPGDLIPLDLFCDLGHVLYSPMGNLRAIRDAALTKVGRERHVVMTLPTFAGVWRAVCSTDLIAIMPEQLARTVAAQTGLDIFEAPMQVDRVKISLIWHKRFSGSPAHCWIRDQIAEVLAPLNDGYPAMLDD